MFDLWVSKSDKVGHIRERIHKAQEGQETAVVGDEGVPFEVPAQSPDQQASNKVIMGCNHVFYSITMLFKSSNWLDFFLHTDLHITPYLLFLTGLFQEESPSKSNPPPPTS